MRTINARRDGNCAECATTIATGDPITKAAPGWVCAECAKTAEAGPTYRERREAKAERLRGWAEAREQKAPALYEAARADEAATGIPFGQPILVGHHSERRHRRAIERIDRNMGAAVENTRKAEAMRSRADNIEAAARQAIYSDDPDAIERLAEKIAALEAERERVKKYNATCRKRAKIGLDALTDEQRAEWASDLEILTPAERRGLLRTIQAVPYQCPGGRMPAYHLTNLGGNINRQKKRLAALGG